MISRRQLLGGGLAAGAGAAVLATTGLAGCTSSSNQSASTLDAADDLVPFYGVHQAGIVTPTQDRLALGVLDVVDGTRPDDVLDLLATWTGAAAAMAEGRAIPGASDDPSVPPADTGEARGLRPGHLTITLGYGPSFFNKIRAPHLRPAALVDLPPLPNEELDPASTGGDLVIQACSDDPQVAFHAVRNLARLGMGTVEHRWMELGFGRTSTTSEAEATPRNLLGFKDGTRNIRAEQSDLLDRYVWVGDKTDQPWLRGGSYLVARRIRMFLENWDRDVLSDQQNVIGRHKDSGAPLGGHGEFDTPDFHAQSSSGEPVIPADSHVRLASHEQNGGLRILRRGYSYTDGIDPERGTLIGGLMFLAYMTDPQQFIALQRVLGHGDALNEYIQHTGSALFAIPPGLTRGQHWGQAFRTA